MSYCLRRRSPLKDTIVTMCDRTYIHYIKLVVYKWVFHTIVISILMFMLSILLFRRLSEESAVISVVVYQSSVWCVVLMSHKCWPQWLWPRLLINSSVESKLWDIWQMKAIIRFVARSKQMSAKIVRFIGFSGYPETNISADCSQELWLLTQSVFKNISLRLSNTKPNSYLCLLFLFYFWD